MGGAGREEGGHARIGTRAWVHGESSRHGCPRCLPVGAHPVRPRAPAARSMPDGSMGFDVATLPSLMRHTTKLVVTK